MTGGTIPFIARYRKERTGNLDEVQITRIAEMNDRLMETDKRKETILKTISEQGKLTEELENKIVNCWDNSVLEDLYLPFKPKRRTKAQIAREQGLEPLATLLLMQREQNPMAASKRFVKDDVQDEAAALQGAKDIIAEIVSEDQQARNTVRNAYKREAMISSRVIKKVEDTDEAQKFSDYFDFFEPLRRCNSHRLLAMRRGEAAGILRVSISIDGEECIDRLNRHFVHGRGACQTLVAEAVEDSFKRLINPSIENEFAGLSKERADEEAIKVFTENLRQLLLSAPLGQKRVLALDPGFANGCKIACLDAQGNLLHHEIIYPHPPKRLYAQATVAVLRMIRQYNIEAIAIGNGTASRESKEFITDCLSHLAEEGKETPKVFVVSEDGASIYSASLTAREEFPDEDVTTRGAVSIGRRLMDPLAELVKIDPKNIGVGQYQHDVDQAKLRHSLDQTVESCVNQVGVNLNTASKHLLMYVSGLGSALAQNIVDYRKEHGAFTSRAQLKKVPRLGAVAFQQCAGFLRIPNAKNPLDNSAVHPESYHIVEAMAEEQKCSVSELISNKELIKHIDLKHYISNEVGLPTLNDILQELEKPGRDPREQLEEFEFDTSVHSIDDLKEGMELPGIVTNITNFGAFVDIGVHQDGLVHISQLSNKFVSDPNTVVHLHQHVRVRVTQIDYKRNRIGLSMKNVKQ
ncbi:RNA-binding transcriptional accessory protein [Prevotella intermedia]|nr:RNA-binding transcriptional accessory protein [Prevotella intermedia]